MAWKLPGFGSKEPDPSYKPTADDFKGENVAESVLKDALQHPATIYPAALSVLSVFWTVVVNPSPQSIGAACLFAFVSASAFVWNYVVKGPEKAAAHVVQLREQRSAYELHSLEQLKTECELAGYIEGAKEVGELKTAYTNLMAYLKQRKQEGSVEQFRLLAEESFREGVQAIAAALNTKRALDTVNTKTLKREIADWKREKELRGDDESPASKALDLQIATHEKRLELYDDSVERLVELIAHVNEIEAALETTYLKVVDLGTKDPSQFLDLEGGAANRLKRAVTAARNVEERLRGRLNSDDAAIRDKYLKAADEQ